ncbi:MAG: cupredoxin family copper-binding protein [Gemmatimonadetes bacterium]|nr:cupredoxin family copper-binding protein [Gemmatimonadota bacterium]MBK7786213.1 cupredoxin family copper-binding protein [Gemmatimonadota bacterium]MBK9065599.1 cupredoxin family copper-binding protein [Gemmatimonadota bacterium]
MHWRLGGGLVGLGAVALSLACYSERGATGPSGGACRVALDPGQFGSVLVAIEGFAFRQTPVHVGAGGKITWVNCETDGTPHTATADGGAWDSGQLDPEGTYTATFAAAGTYDYHCDLHPGMTAQVIVDP